MAKGLITRQYLKDIADAIRFKLGVETQYLPSQMAAAILSIPSGGGGDQKIRAASSMFDLSESGMSWPVSAEQR